MEEQDNFHFYSLQPLPWQLPFLSILQPPLLGLVLLFFLVSLGVLFLVSALQGFEGPSSFGFGFKNGSIGFVSPGGTNVYDTQSEILI